MTKNPKILDRIVLISLVITLLPSSSSPNKHIRIHNNQVDDELHDHRVPELWDPGDSASDNDDANVEILNPEYFDDYEEPLSDYEKQLPREPKKSCKTCQGGVKMSEEDLTALRIEFVKNQILKKLRLTERPTVSVEDLPRPVTEHLFPAQEVDNKDRQSEDYYAKTTKKFIFLQEGE